MKAAKLLLTAAASGALVATAVGQGPTQFPALTPPTSTVPPPLMTAPPFPNSTGIAPQPAFPEGPTIWSRLGISQAQREFCRRNLCRTPFGQLMGRIRSPLSRLSGGLIPPFCPVTPSLAELMDPGVIGAAAKVKQDRAGAAQRIEAIRLLAEVDCNYWPEAEEALIGALRTDRNECVRYEAALALSRGCCCTPKVVVALSHAVCCSEKDGGFMEKSARVRTAAAIALERCLAMECWMPELPAAMPGVVPIPVPLDKEPEGPEGGTGDPRQDSTTSAKFVTAAQVKPGPHISAKPSETMTFAEYYQAVPRLPRNQVVVYARRSLEIGRQIGIGITTEVIEADYEAAGVATPAEMQSMSQKPANLWDILTGKTHQPDLVPIQAIIMESPAKTKGTATPSDLVAKPATPVNPSPMLVAKQPVAQAISSEAVASKPVVPSVSNLGPQNSSPKGMNAPASHLAPPTVAETPIASPRKHLEAKPVIANPSSQQSLQTVQAATITKSSTPNPASLISPPANINHSNLPSVTTPPGLAKVQPTTTVKPLPPVVPAIPTPPVQPITVKPVNPVLSIAQQQIESPDEVPAEPIPVNLPRATPAQGHPKGYYSPNPR
jgi:hypothetical protein